MGQAFLDEEKLAEDAQGGHRSRHVTSSSVLRNLRLSWMLWLKKFNFLSIWGASSSGLTAYVEKPYLRSTFVAGLEGRNKNRYFTPPIPCQLGDLFYS